MKLDEQQSSTKNNNTEHFDVVIAGGGMAGATTALALAKLDLKIALIESIEPQLDTSPSYDQRAVALSAASVEIYKSLNLWSKIQSIACPITDIHISDRGHFGFTRLNAEDYNVEALGQVIPLDLTGPILWQWLKTKKNITTFCPFSVTEIDTNTNLGTTVNIIIATEAVKKSSSQKINLSATLLLAADGTFSSIASMCNIETERTSYHQHAIIANISTELSHNNRAFERFTEQGPLALLPLTRNRMSLVWCQSAENSSQVLALSDSDFIDALQTAFGYRLGKISKVGERTYYPLSLHIPAKPYCGRVLLMGNSAHTLHPIAGQGFNLGLRDIAALFDSIQTALASNQDIGGQEFLSDYIQQRQSDWKRTVTATDSLVRLFSNDLLPLIILRNKALCWLDKLPFAKEILANNAMGFGGESSQLARGIKVDEKLS